MAKISPIYIGFTNKNMDNLLFEVIEIYGNDKYKIIFKNSKYETIARSKEIKNGQIRDIYTPYVYGVGYIGEDNYNANKQIYNIWHHMIRRCYDEKHRDKNPTYADCKVCKDWHNFSNFRKWYEDNYYEVEGEIMHLDKDILFKGNKIYSPQTCIFVPSRINDMFTKSNIKRGMYPIGVSWKSKNQKFQSQCSILKDGKKTMKYLGLYITIEQAFSAYKNFKENYIKEVADEYKDKIPQKLYDAMYRYEVEIDD